MHSPISIVSKTTQLTDSSADLEAQIRRRAYELYELRGRLDGCELEDWLEAEQEIAGGTTLAHAV